MSSEVGFSKDLQKIVRVFDRELESSFKIGELLKRKKSYLDASEYAMELGYILSSVLTMNMSAVSKGYISEILNDRLRYIHNLIVDFCVDVQAYLNRQASIGLKPQILSVKQDKIDGIVNRLVNDSFDKVRWILGTPIVTFSQSVVDRMVEINAKFHYVSGLSPKVIRKEDGNCCKWCKNLVGVYKYPDVPKDVFRRHGNCGCTVEYVPKDGKLRQNVHTKKVKPIVANGNDSLPYKSVKSEWLKSYKEPRVSDAKYWEHEGVRYFVDGKHVVLDYSKREKEVAYIIANKLGVDVKIVPRVSNPKNVKTPDFLINVNKFDLKEIEGEGKYVFDNAVKNKKEQANNFIFDITKTKLSVDESYNRIANIYKNKQRDWIETLILIQNDFIIDILKRN